MATREAKDGCGRCRSPGLAMGDGRRCAFRAISAMGGGPWAVGAGVVSWPSPPWEKAFVGGDVPLMLRLEVGRPCAMHGFQANLALMADIASAWPHLLLVNFFHIYKLGPHQHRHCQHTKTAEDFLKLSPSPKLPLLASYELINLN
uniref:Uncharacterized protein n=1 Tax=Oryza meridionalis TaxID=40149 RepID=A0A0E0E063_9ORYZ